MGKVDVWLKMVRVHTSCLTQAGVVIGLMLGGETDILRYALFMFWAFLFHAWGFAHNNYLDLPFDRRDPSKKHFPLVTGEITERQAFWFVLLSGVGAAGLGLLLSNLSVMAIAFLVGAMGYGILYNHSSKFMPRASPIWITVSFVSIPMFSYFSVSYDWSIPFTLTVKYTIVLMIYQIAVEGYLKDITVPHKNLLLSLGTRLRGRYIEHSLKSRMFMSKIAFFKVIIVGFFLFNLSYSFAQMGFVLITLTIVVWLSYRLSRDMFYDNKRIVRLCSLTEIFTYFLLVFCLSPVIDVKAVVFLIVYPVLWFVAFNRATWGTVVRPKV